MQLNQVICIILAAGTGERMGAPIPKQYCLLNDIEILRYCALKFKHHPLISQVQIVYNNRDENLYNKAVGDLDLLPPIQGASTRSQSVYNGLKAIENYSPQHVLIHDAARPFVSDKIINEVIAAVKLQGSAIPAIKLDDTLKYCENNLISKTIDRTNLYRVQTPQGFNFSDILLAHTNNKNPDLTDDAALYENLGKKTYIVNGDPMNLKITTDEDLIMAEQILNSRKEIRTATGFDVHAFCDPQTLENNYITIGGIKIPYNRSLRGHSDADVALHAITDALLGTISAGDIGTHFPPSDMQYKGADSAIFLTKANELLKEQNAKINNIDVTIICQEPKIGPHRAQMQEKIAAILGIDTSRISVKATTTEGLGFTGRKEGIAAQAIATIEKTIY